MTGLAIMLSALGLAGVATLLMQPVPPLTGLPDVLTNRALLAVQPAILTLICVVIGVLAAPRIGLGAPGLATLLAGASPWAVWRAALVPILAVGLCASVVILVYGTLSASYLGEAAGQGAPILSRVLYGGLTEEIIARWGVMSLLVWLVLRVLPTGDLAYWIGIAGAALLFAAAHLPMIFALVAAPPAGLVLAVLAANALAGAGFGWLFWRHGLEAAMAAHALAHLGVYVGQGLVGKA